MDGFSDTVAWEDFCRSVSVLATAPIQHAKGELAGSAYRAQVGIRDYDKKIAAFYAPLPLGDLDALCVKAGIPFSFRHFGLEVEFETPVRVSVFDEDLRLLQPLKDLVARFGPVVLKNAQNMSTDHMEPQRNIFPHLDFHVDRGGNMDNQYSLYSRDPNDPEQREPRGSSTLFVANIAAHLQALKEGVADDSEPSMKALYHIFQHDGDAEGAIDEVIYRHPWDAPTGTGELVMIDNRTVLHASYHRPKKGWPIGTRYLF